MKLLQILHKDDGRRSRGGSWYDCAANARVGDCSFGPPESRYDDLGFRLYLGVR